MILFPIVGYSKEKMKIHFKECWLEDREFIVNAKLS
jgi:hypothetical protein